MTPGRPTVWIALGAIAGVAALVLLGWTAFSITADVSNGVPPGAVGPLLAMGFGAIALIAVFVILLTRR